MQVPAQAPAPPPAAFPAWRVPQAVLVPAVRRALPPLAQARHQRRKTAEAVSWQYPFLPRKSADQARPPPSQAAAPKRQALAPLAPRQPPRRSLYAPTGQLPDALPLPRWPQAAAQRHRFRSRACLMSHPDRDDRMGSCAPFFARPGVPPPPAVRADGGRNHHPPRPRNHPLLPQTSQYRCPTARAAAEAAGVFCVLPPPVRI